MNADISRQRCYNHSHREAAARCPECGRYYCRECVTEHENRVICASCMAKLTGTEKERLSPLAGLKRIAQFLIGLIILWSFFYMVGQGLLALPVSFHEGTVWHTKR